MRDNNNEIQERSLGDVSLPRPMEQARRGR